MTALPATALPARVANRRAALDGAQYPVSGDANARAYANRPRLTRVNVWASVRG